MSRPIRSILQRTALLSEERSILETPPEPFSRSTMYSFSSTDISSPLRTASLMETITGPYPTPPTTLSSTSLSTPATPPSLQKPLTGLQSEIPLTPTPCCKRSLLPFLFPPCLFFLAPVSFLYTLYLFLLRFLSLSLCFSFFIFSFLFFVFSSANFVFAIGVF